MDDDNIGAGAFETENLALWETLNVTDFSSESFDPLAAIYSSDAIPDDGDVDIYENVEEFLSAHISKYTRKKEKSSALSTNTQSSNSQGLTGSETENEKIKMITRASPPEMTEMIHPDNIQHYSRAQGAGIIKVDVEPENLQDKQNATDPNVLDSAVAATSASETISHRAKPQSRDSSVEEKQHRGTGHRLHTIKHRINVITQMENGFQQGPLSLLRRSVKEKIKVHVWTRSVRNIRGICTGFVVAFDKHMNMALVDVDELYRKPVGKHKKASKKMCRVSNSDCESEDMEHEHKTETKREDSTHYPATPWELVQEVSSTADMAVFSHSSLSGFPQNLQHQEHCLGSVKQSTHHLAKDSSSLWNSDRQVSQGEDVIEEVSSAFSGMHVFQESEVSRLLGVRSRKLLSRHLNQILLRGDHVVAVALAEH